MSGSTSYYDTDGVNDDGVRGATFVFYKSGTNWIQQGSKLVASGFDSDAGQGSAIALSYAGSTLAIAAPRDNGADGGVAIYVRSGSTWTRQGSKLVPNPATDPNDPDGTPVPGFGHDVALSSSGDYLAVGAPYEGSLHIRGSTVVLEDINGTRPSGE
jgi:hypothetical protein